MEFQSHTVILEYFEIKEQALSNFAFQSFYIFIGTQDKNNFSIPVEGKIRKGLFFYVKIL